MCYTNLSKSKLCSKITKIDRTKINLTNCTDTFTPDLDIAVHTYSDPSVYKLQSNTNTIVELTKVNYKPKLHSVKYLNLKQLIFANISLYISAYSVNN